MRNLKVLGLAVVAVLAMSAVTASASQAAQFKAESFPAFVTAEQEGEVNFFKAAGTKVECEIAKFSGTATEASETLTITPTYEKCKTSLGTGATIDVNGCDYLFHAVASGAAGGTVDVVCPTGKQIEVTAGACTIDVPAQKGINGIVYTNLAGPPKDVTLDVASNNIKYNVTNVFLCPLTLGEQANGEYSSHVTTKGFKDEGGKEGAQIGIEVG